MTDVNVNFTCHLNFHAMTTHRDEGGKIKFARLKFTTLIILGRQYYICVVIKLLSLSRTNFRHCRNGDKFFKKKKVRLQ